MSSYEEKKKHSFELGVKAINLLVKEGAAVLYRTVFDKTKEFDPEGKGIHPNTIRKNKELQSYFLPYITAKAPKPRYGSHIATENDFDAFNQI
ncbi:hypothetical protein [Paenibacillus paridis]|uniref:hypothetical protein n=1 Tax=Paenibacillus paridis TaxID=2583376 RepID=UPI001120FEA0|nr:hypothetical protein [Paenibacillus paridis]